MINLNKLRVSLTKHGAYKVAKLLQVYPATEVLQHLNTPSLGIDIDKAQAKKTLSAYNEVIPNSWLKAKEHGKQHINALVMISIIFSHYQLISVFKQSRTSKFQGQINRTDLSTKVYTNIAHTLDELGFSINHDDDYVSYDFSSIFKTVNLSELVEELLTLKLIKADWDQKNTFIQALKIINAHEVFSIDESTLENWFRNTNDIDKPDNIEDLNFFTDETNKNYSQEFSFKPGHNEKDENSSVSTLSKKTINRKNLHNLIQNKLFSILEKEHGSDSVGTEIPTGYGTYIDLVLSVDDECTLYEIKTANSSKLCIRQAIPQLLEYAYWPNKSNALKLIITSQNSACNDSISYLKNLRDKFNIPIFYQQFDIENNTLLEEV